PALPPPPPDPPAAPQACTNLLMGLAKLRLVPRARWLRKLCCGLAPRLGCFSARDVAHLTWALQHLQFVPDAEWLCALQVAISARLHHFDTASLVILVSGLGGYCSKASQLQLDPGVVEALHLQLGPRLPSLGCHSCCTVCVALSRLNMPGGMPRHLHQALLQQVASLLPLMSSRQAANTALALARLARRNGDLHLRSGLTLLPRLADSVAAQLATANMADLVQTAQALALVRAGSHPGEPWLAAHEAAVQQLVQRGVVHRLELAPLLTAYQQLAYSPAHLHATLFLHPPPALRSRPPLPLRWQQQQPVMIRCRPRLGELDGAELQQLGRVGGRQAGLRRGAPAVAAARPAADSAARAASSQNCSGSSGSSSKAPQPPSVLQALVLAQGGPSAAAASAQNTGSTGSTYNADSTGST
ncbi:hypothetical protein QJQ45_014877, partial [Haematococcus lacustris]